MSCPGSKNGWGGSAAGAGSSGGASRQPVCPNCNVEANVFTSHTAANPSRVFFKCPHYSKEGCQFWRWADSWDWAQDEEESQKQQQDLSWRGVEQEVAAVGETLRRHGEAAAQRMEQLEQWLRRHWEAVDRRMEGLEQSQRRHREAVEQRMEGLGRSLQDRGVEERVAAVEVQLSRLVKVAGVALLLLLYLVLVN